MHKKKRFTVDAGTVEILTRFLVALGLGVLVGLEREYTQAKRKVPGYGGIRTFPLIALLGALAGFLSESYSGWLAISTFAGVALLIIVSHYFTALKTGRIGITSEIAGLITFFIGILSARGEFIIAVPMAVIMTLLLYESIELHWFAAHLHREELHSTIKFAIITLVILPLTPDVAYGPLGFFNPQTIWMMVVLVSGISFSGYILTKVIGKRSMELAGFFGGFVSSTATTFSLIERGKKSGQALTGIIIANAAMLTKVLILVFIINRGVFKAIFIPFILMIVSSSLIALMLALKHSIKKQVLELESPFALKPALKFAVIFAGILFIVKAATFYLGQRGTYAVSFLSGLIDADATVLSTLQLINNGFIGVASTAVVLAVIANTLAKGLLVLFLGKKELGMRALVTFCVIAVIGAVGLL